MRAFVVVFFHKLAVEEGFDSIEASDEDTIQSAVGDIIEILSIAIADGDQDRQQFAHERLFQVSILENAKKVEAEHMEAAIAVLYQEFEAKKAAARLAGTPLPKKRQSVKPTVQIAATALRAQVMSEKRCNTLQLREGCLVVDVKPNELLSQLLRIARTGFIAALS